jgi:hypothetical protein
MNSVLVDLKSEIKTRGVYRSEGLWYGGPYARVERLTPPITPAENLLRYYRGEEYAWIPDIASDQVDITPACIPDCVATGFEGGYDSFGVKWVPESADSGLPSFVEPGVYKLHDIADWRELRWPDVDSWDWKGCAKSYRDAYRDDDRLLRGILLTGLFERLISLMGFEEAAVSLLEDPDEVAAFFDRLADTNIRIMDHYIDDFGCQSIMIHDDWSAAKAPFFSLDTAMELMVPPMKKMASRAHARGAAFTIHSCGNGLDLVPAYKATGADAWQVQIDAFDTDALYEACGDDLIIEQYPMVPEGIQGIELESYIRGMFEKYCLKHRGLITFNDMDEERLPTTRKLVYQIGRELAISTQAHRHQTNGQEGISQSSRQNQSLASQH